MPYTPTARALDWVSPPTNRTPHEPLFAFFLSSTRFCSFFPSPVRELALFLLLSFLCHICTLCCSLPVLGARFGICCCRPASFCHTSVGILELSFQVYATRGVVHLSLRTFGGRFSSFYRSLVPLVFTLNFLVCSVAALAGFSRSRAMYRLTSALFAATLIARTCPQYCLHCYSLVSVLDTCELRV